MTDPAPSNQAFTAILEKHRGAILRYVRSLVRDSGEAEDIAQETFFRAYRNLASLQDPSKLRPWLYRIATNLSCDRFRQASTRPSTQSLEIVPVSADERRAAEAPDPNSPKLDQVVEQKEMSDCVRQYLEGLSDSYRAVILLHDVEGLSNPEIAEMLGCSLPTVKIRLHRARARLKTALDRACNFSCDNRGVLICEPKPPASNQERK